MIPILVLDTLFLFSSPLAIFSCLLCGGILFVGGRSTREMYILESTITFPYVYILVNVIEFPTGTYGRYYHAESYTYWSNSLAYIGEQGQPRKALGD